MRSIYTIYSASQILRYLNHVLLPQYLYVTISMGWLTTDFIMTGSGGITAAVPLFNFHRKILPTLITKSCSYLTIITIKIIQSYLANCRSLKYLRRHFELLRIKLTKYCLKGLCIDALGQDFSEIKYVNIWIKGVQNLLRENKKSMSILWDCSIKCIKSMPSAKIKDSRLSRDTVPFGKSCNSLLA